MTSLKERILQNNIPDYPQDQNEIENSEEEGTDDDSIIDDDNIIDDVNIIEEDDLSQGNQIPVSELRIKFDVIDTNNVDDGTKKYTVYTIVVLEMSKMDADQAIIKRRYSEFYQLHKNLRSEIPEAMRNVKFPKKKFFSKRFTGVIVEDRTRAFEKYLQYIYQQEGVRTTKAFSDFFYKPHLKEATQHLKCESYEQSFEGYRLAFELQKKLGSNRETMIVAMCGIVETSKNLKVFERAEQIGEECLNFMLYDVSNIFLLGLLQSVMDAKKRLKKPTEGMKEKLKECLKKSASDQDSIQSLRVLLVKQF